MTTREAENERIRSEWLSLYLTHCRRELSRHELTELARALERGVDYVTRAEFSSRVAARVATVAQPLVDFIANAPSSAGRASLAREASARLYAFAHAR